MRSILDFRFWISDWRKRSRRLQPTVHSSPKSRIQNPKSAAVLFVLLALVAPTLLAQDRTPDDAEKLYKQVGSQLFCMCGCRENLLVCSHNVCSAKTQEREFLRELSKDAKLDEAAIKQQMVDRFGKEVLQVPEQSTLYPILAVAGVVLLAAFGFGFWTITRRGDKPAAEAATIDPEVEARIARELKELD
jgi:cytochrome c-type biogenesis protein CcmH/NrfF